MNGNTRAYKTPAAFRRALEERLKQRSQNTGEDLIRLRRLVAFDRLLARIFPENEKSPWIVKGGFAFEIRYRMQARVTKDIDLGIPKTVEDITQPDIDFSRIHESLQDAAEKNIGDDFIILIGEPSQNFEAPPDGGRRFPVEVLLDGRTFAKFHLDVGAGDIMLKAPENKQCEEFLSFAGIPPATIPLICISQQFAEKIHAYSFPWKKRANTRVKDLVDLVLLIERENLSLPELSIAIQATFKQRNTHSVPFELPHPPVEWEAPYSRLAIEANLKTTGFKEAVSLLAGFWSKIPIERNNQGEEKHGDT